MMALDYGVRGEEVYAEFRSQRVVREKPVVNSQVEDLPDMDDQCETVSVKFAVGR